MKRYIYFFIAFLSSTILHGQFQLTRRHMRGFDYYKAKTIEILNALEIDASKLTFTAVGHNVTIEERDAHKTTVLLNVAKLSVLTEREALFECLVEAQLSSMSSAEWDRITNVRSQVKLVPYWLPYALSLPSICYIATWIRYRPTFSVIREIPFAAFAAISMYFSVTTFYDYSDTDGYHIPIQAHIKNNFELKKLFIQIDTVHKLINSHKYVPIALQAIRSVEWQRPKIETYNGYINANKAEIEDATFHMTSAFEQWKENNPKAYATLCEMSWEQHVLE